MKIATHAGGDVFQQVFTVSIIAFEKLKKLLSFFSRALLSCILTSQLECATAPMSITICIFVLYVHLHSFDVVIHDHIFISLIKQHPEAMALSYNDGLSLQYCIFLPYIFSDSGSHTMQTSPHQVFL